MKAYLVVCPTCDHESKPTKFESHAEEAAVLHNYNNKDHGSFPIKIHI